MITYILSGDDDLLLGRPGEAVAMDDSEIADPFDESVVTKMLPAPWDSIDSDYSTDASREIAGRIDSRIDVEFDPLPPIAVDALTPHELTSRPTPAGPTYNDVRARKLLLCDMIERVGLEIAEVEHEIAGLSADLKAAKKLREAKHERLQELAVEMRNAKKHLTDKMRSKAGSENGIPADDDESESEGDADIDDDSEVDSTPTSEPADSEADYNPWDFWEQGRGITSVRLLVPIENMTAGAALAVLDVEPPQVDGDSLSGSVLAFRLGSDREQVTLDKRDCSPMLSGVREAEIGWRIGSPRAAKESGQKTKEDDSWKSVLVSTLDLPESTIAVLIDDNGIRTIGDIQEWTRWQRLNDLKKVGDAKAAKIEEALMKFWSSR